MYNKQIFQVFFAAIMFAFAGAVSAQSPQTTSFSVTSTVAANCTIAATPVAFGVYDPVTANATAALTNSAGTVAVTCTKGALPVIAMDAGLNGGAAGVTRSMKGAGANADLLGYELYLPSSTAASAACTFSGSAVWNTTVGSGTLATTAALSKDARSYYICGSVPPGQDVAVDSYTDTVIVSVTF
jgi:spore coat protein U-like protein